ncbi:MAG: hypothetical protein KKD39_06780 [Candidatus Altiarchaeota archaeon]|nr:hypothetical protein [Candidatus Altiarchaeota archaeon]
MVRCGLSALCVLLFFATVGYSLSGPGNPYPSVSGERADSEVPQMVVSSSPLSTAFSPYPAVPKPKASCVDTDGGLNSFVKGETYFGSLKYFRDTCVSTSMLYEGVCDSRARFEVNWVPVYCELGCINGACRDPSKRIIAFEENASGDRGN